MPSKTEVVHVKNGFDVYIGRAMPGHPASEFANTFRIGVDGTRDEVIDKYERYIVERLTNEPKLRAELEGMRGKRWGCWCKPKRCHGDPLLRWLEGPEEPPAPPAQFSLF